MALCVKAGGLREVCAVPFFAGLACPLGPKKTRAAGSIERHGGKILGYAQICSKNPIIGHTNPFKVNLRFITT